mmetsp:Transcript_18758/g.48114  ORF Transcript_18758/g.48114 Transcript_18758/m.48114 type:complete len:215 (+) Transcript_18758:411-1055(+)
MQRARHLRVGRRGVHLLPRAPRRGVREVRPRLCDARWRLRLPKQRARSDRAGRHPYRFRLLHPAVYCGRRRRRYLHHFSLHRRREAQVQVSAIPPRRQTGGPRRCRPRPQPELRDDAGTLGGLTSRFLRPGPQQLHPRAGGHHASVGVRLAAQPLEPVRLRGTHPALGAEFIQDDRWAHEASYQPSVQSQAPQYPRAPSREERARDARHQRHGP